MEPNDNLHTAEQLQKEIMELEKELEKKRKLLLSLQNSPICDSKNQEECITNKDISRYSRQIIVPNIGLKGQALLKKASVLVVGVGGLGCPASLYLCSSGIGTIGLIDYDEVETNNLHRQILHTESTVGVSKVRSAAAALKRLNSDVETIIYEEILNSGNALGIISEYDIVLDATDNVATRYLLNDACVLKKRPLISGAALQLEGQLTIYNYNGSPCYRCIFPTPPPPQCTNNCSSSGILGPVCGVIGTLQALEAIKMIVGIGDVLHHRLLVFDAMDITFKCIKLRNKQANCSVCSNNPTITSLIDYERFCGAPANDKGEALSLLNANRRIQPTELNKIRMRESPHLLIDVRSSAEYEMCKLPNSVNIPIDKLNSPCERLKLIDKVKNAKMISPSITVIFICRRGNDSQRAVQKIEPEMNEIASIIADVEGGLHAWSKLIDPTFPIY